MPAEGLRQGLKKPSQRVKPPASLPSLVDFSIGARYQVLEVAPRLGLRSKRGQLGQVRRRSLIQEVEMPELLERHAPARATLKPLEHLLQLGPVGPLRRQETLEVNDHGAIRGMDQWIDGLMDCWIVGME